MIARIRCSRLADRSRGAVLSSILALSVAATAQEPDPSAADESAAQRPTMRVDQVTDVASLIRYVQERERAVESVRMEIQTEGSFPDGTPFETTGSVRVLGETHFKAQMSARFGEGMEVETETVRTPEGMWLRERDPVQGEVYLRMDATTMARVESASAALGGSGSALAGAGGGRGESPLGGSLLTDLDRQFELSLDGPRVVNGESFWVVDGPARGSDHEDDLLGLGADRVDVLVRVADGAVLRMAQLRDGQPLLEVRIVEMEFGAALVPSDFVLSARSGEPIDILDHPPARAQIERLLQEARDKGWKDPGGR